MPTWQGLDPTRLTGWLQGAWRAEERASLKNRLACPVGLVLRSLSSLELSLLARRKLYQILETPVNSDELLESNPLCVI
jgi:hypothetical protein